MPASWRAIFYIVVSQFPLSVKVLHTNKVDGYCLRLHTEQKGSLRFLAQVERELGWRTTWMVEELEQQWRELQRLDSWR